MNIQTTRWLLYLFTGLILLVFGVGTLIRGWRKHRRLPHWPVPWGALSGWFLLSVAAVQLSDAARVAEDWPLNYEYRLSVASLAFCAVMSCWMFWRWWADGEDMP